MKHATLDHTHVEPMRTTTVRRSFLLSAALCIVASTGTAQVMPYPASFRIQEITTNGATLHVRIGGSGPAAVLLHGFGDTGDMWAFAFAARHPQRIARLVLMDAPLPGVSDREAYSHEPRTWHFHFQRPDEERLVAGRGRIYLDRFWNEFSADPARIDEQTREHYASLYARTGATQLVVTTIQGFLHS